MSLTAPRGSEPDLIELWSPHEVIESAKVFTGLVFDVRRDTVDLGAGGVVKRDYVEHPGAVAVVALHEFDDVLHVLLIRQYRHAAKGHLWELPAGLLDVDGEPPWQTAARELAEEVDLEAERWEVLVDDISSPGILPETIRIFLARDVRDVAAEHAHERSGEELDIEPLWVPLDDALDAVLAGRVSNAHAVVGVLAAGAARDRGWSTVRPRDAPWPAREAQARWRTADEG